MVTLKRSVIPRLHSSATLQRPCQSPRSEKAINLGHYRCQNPSIWQIKDYVTTGLATMPLHQKRCWLAATTLPTKRSFAQRCHYDVDDHTTLFHKTVGRCRYASADHMTLLVRF